MISVTEQAYFRGIIVEALVTSTICRRLTSNTVFMNSKKIFTACVIVLLTGACEELDKLLTFTISDRTAIQIESTSPLNLPLEIPTPAVTSNSEQQFTNNNTRADLVKDVKLQKLKLTITDPPSKTFSFLNTIRIFISTDQYDEIELASLENIPAGSNSIELTPTEQKLDTYIKAPSYNLRTEVTMDETLTETVNVEVDLKFLVTADTF
jgi:hypothetical protein